MTKRVPFVAPIHTWSKEGGLPFEHALNPPQSVSTVPYVLAQPAGESDLC